MKETRTEIIGTLIFMIVMSAGLSKGALRAFRDLLFSSENLNQSLN
ncbi:MAG: hypothetical protein KJ666_12140 [Bacteroidetes bacterium]|nr:hypothetical protein [Bacteroidota bacterium]